VSAGPTTQKPKKPVTTTARMTMVPATPKIWLITTAKARTSAGARQARPMRVVKML
jgi:hypothetical protein